MKQEEVSRLGSHKRLPSRPRGEGKSRKEKICELQGLCLAHKKYLTLIECEAYTDRSESTLLAWFKQYGIFKTLKGYYRREEIDKLLGGELTEVMQMAQDLKTGGFS